jgi:outer membrane protein
MTDSRAKSGLIPEVDASLAKAEVSNAKSLQIKSYDKVLEYSKSLAVLLADEFQTYQLDSLYSTSVPLNKFSATVNTVNRHPLLQFQESRVNESVQAEQF